MKEFSAGQIVGQYTIIGVLGRGRSTVSYVAEQPSLSRKVVVKTLPIPPADPDIASQFTQAAKFVAQMDSPVVAPVYEATILDDTCLLVEKYIEGGALADRLESTLTAEEAANMLAAVAHALESLHARGIAYGRLTPNNLLLAPGGAVLLDDLVFARIASAPESMPGVNGAYLPPERRTGQPATTTGDIFALGVLAIHLSMGPAFAARTGNAESPIQVPREIAWTESRRRAVQSAIAPEPSKRTQSIATIVDEFRAKAVASGRGASALNGKPHPPRPGLWLAWALLGILMVAVVAVSAVMFNQQQQCKQIGVIKLVQAQQYVDNRKYDDARRAYQAVLDCDSANADAVAGLGLVADKEQLPAVFAAGQRRFDDGDFVGALEQWGRVKKSDPSYPGLNEKLYGANASRAVELVQSGTVISAVAYFNEALALRPNDAAVAVQRQQAVLFVDAQKAYDGRQWTAASDKFANLYAATPGYQPNLPALLFNSYVNAAKDTWQEHRCTETVVWLVKAAAISSIDVGVATTMLAEVRAACATPTPTPSPTSTPRPVPTPTPHYCFVPEVVGQAERPGVIYIEGKVLDRTGKGVAGMLVKVRPRAGGPDVFALTVPSGDFNYHGLNGAADWLISMKDYESRERLVSFPGGGWVIFVNIQEKPCPSN
ncbi:MAG: protein kinase [Chloroflexi bacterium]|nr:protein kinase [Chloroflexota bacterium]